MDLIAELNCPEAKRLSAALGLQLVDKSESELALHYSEGVLSLTFPCSKQGDISVNFESGASEFRRLHGGGFGQPVAKATGISAKLNLTVLDLTAGLGRDAFVLASLGAKVYLVERNPIVWALLDNGLSRAQNSASDVSAIARNMQLISADSLTASKLPKADVVFVDPMFPERKKAAAVKKEMAAFHQLVGADTDSDGLLSIAMSLAGCRVVVKRPKNAPYLSDKTPTTSHKGKAGRFDIYSLKKLSVENLISATHS